MFASIPARYGGAATERTGENPRKPSIFCGFVVIHTGCIYIRPYVVLTFSSDEALFR
jgi:hypothetical protein